MCFACGRSSFASLRSRADGHTSMITRDETTTALPTTLVDAASVAAFRVGFGALMLVATVRFAARGWIDEILDRPTFHFTFTFFEWVKPLPQPWLDVQYAVMAVSATLLMLGVRARVSAGVFFVLFTWAELIEKAAYLNHYFLVSLVALLLTLVRTDQCFALLPEARSVDDDGRIDARLLWLFRGQVIVVYAAAGLAKVSSDWLVHAEPLRIWLQHTAHLPVIGPLLSSTIGAHAFSIGGCLFDLTIWAFILWRRTRAVAYVAAVGFHLTVWALFPIGLFSPVMMLAATLLFSPSWPRRLLRLAPKTMTTTPTTTTWPTYLVALWLTVQVLLPLRHYAIAGDTNWTELGFRFAWRVMLIEKTGSVEYRVVVDGKPPVRVFPADELTELQQRQLRTQPDLIRQYARHLEDTFVAGGARDVRVYADAWASLNGRAAQRLIDPTVDLASVDDCIWSASWIVPLTTPFPMRMTPSRTGAP